MALSQTDVLVETVTVGGAGTFTTSSFTPPNNSLVVLRVAGTGASNNGQSGATLTHQSNTLGLTYTKRVNTTTSPNWSYGDAAWTTEITTGAAGTVTFNFGGNGFQFARVEIFAFTDYNTSSPTGGTAAGSDADGNGAPTSLTLSSTPASDSIVLAFANVNMDSGSGAVTQGAGWTEMYDVAATDWATFQSQKRTGSTSTAVDWGDLSTAGTPSGATLMAIEIKAAAGGGGLVVNPISGRGGTTAQPLAA